MIEHHQHNYNGAHQYNNDGDDDHYDNNDGGHHENNNANRSTRSSPTTCLKLQSCLRIN